MDNLPLNQSGVWRYRDVLLLDNDLKTVSAGM
jgi:hypothetical protein